MCRLAAGSDVIVLVTPSANWLYPSLAGSIASHYSLSLVIVIVIVAILIVVVTLGVVNPAPLAAAMDDIAAVDAFVVATIRVVVVARIGMGVLTSMDGVLPVAAAPAVNTHHAPASAVSHRSTTRVAAGALRTTGTAYAVERLSPQAWRRGRHEVRRCGGGTWSSSAAAKTAVRQWHESRHCAVPGHTCGLRR